MHTQELHKHRAVTEEENKDKLAKHFPNILVAYIVFAQSQFHGFGLISAG